MDLHLILNFTVMVTILVMSPGPNFLLITKSMTTGTRARALANIPGFLVACFMHGALSIFGVSAIMLAVPAFMIAVKALGAFVFLYLGVQSLMAPKASVPDVTALTNHPVYNDGNAGSDIALNNGRAAFTLPQTIPALDIDLGGSSTVQRDKSNCVSGLLTSKDQYGSSDRSIRHGFRDGFIINFLNPKTIIFYLAAFQQFTDGSSNVVMASVVLVLIHATISALWFTTVVLALGQMLMRPGSTSFVHLLQKLSGFALIGFSTFIGAGVAHGLLYPGSH